MRTKILPGCPEAQDGYLWSNGHQVLGENLASGYPLQEDSLNGGRFPLRRIDGTVVPP